MLKNTKTNKKFDPSNLSPEMLTSNLENAKQSIQYWNEMCQTLNGELIKAQDELQNAQSSASNTQIIESRILTLQQDIMAARENYHTHCDLRMNVERAVAFQKQQKPTAPAPTQTAQAKTMWTEAEIAKADLQFAQADLEEARADAEDAIAAKNLAKAEVVKIKLASKVAKALIDAQDFAMLHDAPPLPAIDLTIYDVATTVDDTYPLPLPEDNSDYTPQNNDDAYNQAHDAYKAAATQAAHMRAIYLAKDMVLSDAQAAYYAAYDAAKATSKTPAIAHTEVAVDDASVSTEAATPVTITSDAITAQPAHHSQPKHQDPVSFTLPQLQQMVVQTQYHMYSWGSEIQRLNNELTRADHELDQVKQALQHAQASVAFTHNISAMTHSNISMLHNTPLAAQTAQATQTMMVDLQVTSKKLADRITDLRKQWHFSAQQHELYSRDYSHFQAQLEKESAQQHAISKDTETAVEDKAAVEKRVAEWKKQYEAAKKATADARAAAEAKAVADARAASEAKAVADARAASEAKAVADARAASEAKAAADAQKAAVEDKASADAAKAEARNKAYLFQLKSKLIEERLIEAKFAATNAATSANAAKLDADNATASASKSDQHAQTAATAAMKLSDAKDTVAKATATYANAVNVELQAALVLVACAEAYAGNMNEHTAEAASHAFGSFKKAVDEAKAASDAVPTAKIIAAKAKAAADSVVAEAKKAADAFDAAEAEAVADAADAAKAAADAAKTAEAEAIADQADADKAKAVADAADQAEADAKAKADAEALAREFAEIEAAEAEAVARELDKAEAAADQAKAAAEAAAAAKAKVDKDKAAAEAVAEAAAKAVAEAQKATKAKAANTKKMLKIAAEAEERLLDDCIKDATQAREAYNTKQHKAREAQEAVKRNEMDDRVKKRKMEAALSIDKKQKQFFIDLFKSYEQAVKDDNTEPNVNIYASLKYNPIVNQDHYLYYAVLYDQSAHIIRLLIARGANPNQENPRASDYTPLQLAELKHARDNTNTYREDVKVILSHPEAVTALVVSTLSEQDLLLCLFDAISLPNEYTPEEIEQRQKFITSSLVKAKIDGLPICKMPDALMLAIRANLFSIVKPLLEKDGCNPHNIDCDGYTAFEAVRCNTDIRIVDILLRHLNLTDEKKLQLINEHHNKEQLLACGLHLPIATAAAAAASTPSSEPNDDGVEPNSLFNLADLDVTTSVLGSDASQ